MTCRWLSVAGPSRDQCCERRRERSLMSEPHPPCGCPRGSVRSECTCSVVILPLWARAHGTFDRRLDRHRVRTVPRPPGHLRRTGLRVPRPQRRLDACPEGPVPSPKQLERLLQGERFFRLNRTVPGLPETGAVSLAVTGLDNQVARLLASALRARAPKCDRRVVATMVGPCRFRHRRAGRR